MHFILNKVAPCIPHSWIFISMTQPSFPKERLEQGFPVKGWNGKYTWRRIYFLLYGKILVVSLCAFKHFSCEVRVKVRLRIQALHSSQHRCEKQTCCFMTGKSVPLIFRWVNPQFVCFFWPSDLLTQLWSSPHAFIQGWAFTTTPSIRSV